jgi:hypothetical protein
MHFVNFRLEHAEIRLLVSQEEGNCNATDKFRLKCWLIYCMGLRMCHFQYSWDGRLCCKRKRYWGDFSKEICLTYGWYLMTFSLSRKVSTVTQKFKGSRWSICLHLQQCDGFIAHIRDSFLKFTCEKSAAWYTGENCMVRRFKFVFFTELGWQNKHKMEMDCLAHIQR